MLLFSRGKKSNKENIDTSTPEDDRKTSYQSYGRYIARLVDFFQVLDRIVDAGIRSEVESDADASSDEGSSYVYLMTISSYSPRVRWTLVSPT